MSIAHPAYELTRPETSYTNPLLDPKQYAQMRLEIWRLTDRVTKQQFKEIESQLFYWQLTLRDAQYGIVPTSAEVVLTAHRTMLDSANKALYQP